jgi:CTP synthase
VGLADANSSEFEPNGKNRVIDLMPTQRGVSDKGGTMRLGQWVCCLTPGSKAHAAYGDQIVFERHRHRYEFNNAYRKRFEAAGMVLSGRSADNKLIEIIELKDHPWFVGTQFHPEFKSRPTRPHPLFRDFVGAAARRAGQLTSGERAQAPEAESDSVRTASNGHSAEADRAIAGVRGAQE